MGPQVGPRLGHTRFIGMDFSPLLQEIIIGNMLTGDMKCITPSLSHTQTVLYKDRGLSALSFLSPRLLIIVLKEFSDSDCYYSG